MPHDHGPHGHGHHGHSHAPDPGFRAAQRRPLPGMPGWTAPASGHSHGHSHAHPPASAGHNHADGDHLHSHLHPEDNAADLQVLTAQFVDGFVQAADKTAYLRLAGVPFERPGTGGATALKLVDVELKTDWQVGTAAPSFGSRELSYLPFPGPMVRERTNMALVYVSMDEKQMLDIRDFLASRRETYAA